MANQDKKETSRKLSAREEKRFREFNEKCERWVADGYTRTDLTVSIVKANVFAIGMFVPLIVVFGGLFFLVNRNRFSFNGKTMMLALTVFYLLSIVIHEGIHGITWSLFSKNGNKDIEYGFMVEYLTPYATCKEPLLKKPYIIGALMPCIILGIIPSILSIVLNSFSMLVYGIMMIASAGGDILIVWEILKHPSEKKEQFYMDHPTQAGGVLFEK